VPRALPSACMIQNEKGSRCMHACAPCVLCCHFDKLILRYRRQHGRTPISVLRSASSRSQPLCLS
jgi:hypothetical protein